MARIDVAVLGPPNVSVDGVPVPLSGRQLALAVRLAIAGQTPVPIHRLADVWPESNASDGAIRVALTRLRQAIGPNSVVRIEHGYVLSPSAHLDADRFDMLLASARDQTISAASRIETVAEALQLWAGPAYAGIERSAWVEYEAIRLDELREHALDVSFELAVEHGADDAVVADLRAALARMPERERRCELLAIALYRAGRQSEALEVITATRRRLRDELGLALGGAAADLEARILAHDPTLLADQGGDRQRPRDPRLSSATGLLREGMVEDALVISGELVQAAREDRDRRRIAEALLVRAQAIAMSGHDDPDPVIAEAQAIARSLGDGRLLARAAIVRFGSGVPPDRTKAMIELGEPLDLLALSAPERVELLCAAAVIVTFLDLDTAADRVLLAAKRTFEAQNDARSEAVWLAARSIVGSVRGADADDVRQLAMRAVALAQEIDDPSISTVVIHAELRSAYSDGDLDRVDELIGALETAAQRGLLPFGIVRAHLCRVSNAMARGDLASVPALIETAIESGRRLRTHSSQPAAQSQQLALALEHDTLGAVIDLLRAGSLAEPTSASTGLAAYAGDDADRERLRHVLPDIRLNSGFPVIVAVASLVAGRYDDAVVARWARPHLIELDDRTIFVGFGTLALGFGRFYLGLVEHALGDLDAARRALSTAIELSDRSGAALWSAHARLWLADTLLDLGDDQLQLEAAELVSAVSRSAMPAASRRVDAHARRLWQRQVGHHTLRSLIEA
ncbi:MAG: BTAD domain-containing putative transcriptional regulator [Ilumatobacteraceae bacterium]